MDNIQSNNDNNELNDLIPRKKLRKTSNFVSTISRDEYNLERDENQITDKVEMILTEAEEQQEIQGEELKKLKIEVSLKEDEIFLLDSENEANNSGTREENSTEKFEVRHIKLARFYGEGSSQNDGNSPSCSTSLKYSECRGEEPEMNESFKNFQYLTPEKLQMEMSDCDEGIGLVRNPQIDETDDDKKTPDRSVFKKIHEKLLYECNLTPKKVRKKLWEYNMDS